MQQKCILIILLGDFFFLMKPNFFFMQKCKTKEHYFYLFIFRNFMAFLTVSCKNFTESIIKLRFINSINFSLKKCKLKIHNSNFFFKKNYKAFKNTDKMDNAII